MIVERDDRETDLGRCVCVVEGRDDAVVLEAVRRAAALGEISFVAAGSIDNVGPVLSLLTVAGRITVAGTSVGVVVDADTDPVTARARLDGWRRDHAADGTRWELMVVPPDGPGELETLIERSLDAGLLACVDSFVACVEPLHGASWRKPAKIRVGVARAVIGRAPASLGVLVEQGAVDVRHSAFDGLRAFLVRLIGDGADRPPDGAPQSTGGAGGRIVGG